MTGKGFFPHGCSSHSVEPYCQFLEFLLSIVVLRKHLPLPCPRVLPDISGFSQWCLIYIECGFMWDGRYGSSVICHTWTFVENATGWLYLVGLFLPVPMVCMAALCRGPADFVAMLCGVIGGQVSVICSISFSA